LATPEQISALTQRIRESIKISDDYIYDPDMYKNLETASQEVEADQTVAITLPKFSKPFPTTI